MKGILQLIYLKGSVPHHAIFERFTHTGHKLTLAALTLAVMSMLTFCIRIYAHESAPAAVSSNHWRSRLARVDGRAARSLRII